MINALNLLIVLGENVWIVAKDVLIVHQQLVCNALIILVFLKANAIQIVSRLGKGL